MLGALLREVDATVDEQCVIEHSAVLDREVGQDRGPGLGSFEGDGGTPGAAVDGRGCSAAGAGDGDGLAQEVDVFVIRAGGDEDGIAGVGGVDAGLDRGVGLSGADVERDLRGEARGSRQDEERGGAGEGGFQRETQRREHDWPVLRGGRQYNALDKL